MASFVYTDSSTQRHLICAVDVTNAIGMGYNVYVNGVDTGQIVVIASNTTQRISIYRAASPNTTYLVELVHNYTTASSTTITTPAELVPPPAVQLAGIASGAKFDVTSQLSFSCTASSYDANMEYSFGVNEPTLAHVWYPAWTTATSMTMPANALPPGEYNAFVLCRIAGTTSYSVSSIIPITGFGYTQTYSNITQRSWHIEYTMTGLVGATYVGKLANHSEVGRATITSSPQVVVAHGTGTPGTAFALYMFINDVLVTSDSINMLAEAAPAKLNITSPTNGASVSNSNTVGSITVACTPSTYDGTISKYIVNFYNASAGVRGSLYASYQCVSASTSLGLLPQGQQFAVGMTCFNSAPTPQESIESDLVFFTTAAPIGPTGTYINRTISTPTQRHWEYVVRVEGGSSDVCSLYQYKYSDGLPNKPMLVRQNVAGGIDYIYFGMSDAEPNTRYDILITVGGITAHGAQIYTTADTTPAAVTLTSPVSYGFSAYATIPLSCVASPYDHPSMKYEFLIADAISTVPHNGDNYAGTGPNFWDKFDQVVSTPSTVMPANTVGAGGGYYAWVRCGYDSTWSVWTSAHLWGTDADPVAPTPILNFTSGVRFPYNVTSFDKIKIDESTRLPYGQQTYYQWLLTDEVSHTVIDLYDPTNLMAALGTYDTAGWQMGFFTIRPDFLSTEHLYSIQSRVVLWTGRAADIIGEYCTKCYFTIAPDFRPNNFKINNQPHRRM